MFQKIPGHGKKQTKKNVLWSICLDIYEANIYEVKIQCLC